MPAQFNVALYRDNANNRTIAGSTTGAVGSPTEPLFIETLKTGTITVSTAVVTGTGTSFTVAGSATEVNAGDYITTAAGLPIGIVASVESNTQFTLTATTLTTVTAVRFYTTDASVFLKNESILLRITPIKNGSTSVTVPDLSNLRLPASLSQDNYTNPLYIKLALEGGLGIGDYTNVGTVQNVTVEPISCGRRIYGNTPCFPASASTDDDIQTRSEDALNNTVANFPTQLWYVLNPYGATTSNLAANTTYDWAINDVLPELVLSTANLQDFGVTYILLNSFWTRRF